jgi:hypothetical protein
MADGQAREAWESSDRAQPFRKVDRNRVARRFGLHHNIDKLLHSGECSDQSSGTERLAMEKIASCMYDSAVQPSGYYMYRQV